jgi:ATP-dependent helicase/nuclease subunit B
VQVTFLLGPAGSGKTYRCLAEIRAELSARPEGPPLLLLAPKQATFQLERQLLADPELAGYSRLQIVAFDRLADFILRELGETPPRILAEEGRVMVLRALLARHQLDLRVFRATARLPGFAQQLSLLLREVQRYQLSPNKLMELVALVPAEGRLGDKLHDISLILGAYNQWLKDHQLNDASALLDLATTALKHSTRRTNETFQLGGLWMDGFAEMTPQELHLLATFLPLCEHATLAFCLDGEPQGNPSWLSQWSVVAQTYRNCRNRLVTDETLTVRTETLARDPAHSRFKNAPALAHLEANWTTPKPYAEASNAVELVECFDAEAEVLHGARLIHQHVRAGGRYREVAVLLRSMEGHQDIVQRVFHRHGIPYFMDRRESVAHHPLAELTRSALRLAAFGWRHDDWFAALKCGLVTIEDQQIDALENEALARGWNHARWREPIVIEKEPALAERMEALRQRLVPPFVQFVDALTKTGGVSGNVLANAVRQLWIDLKAPATLEAWSQKPDPQHPQFAAIHQTVWEQLNEWCDNLELAFGNDLSLGVRDWLSVSDAGLAGLTVGVIPPALDQVLVGAIDRSRNPDLQLAIVLGVNEGHFPAPPETPLILTEIDRKVLAQQNVTLGLDSRQRLAHERYFGYIAFTRSQHKLVVCWSRQNQSGLALNPSPFVDQLRQLFPQNKVVRFNGSLEPAAIQTLPELLALPHWPERLQPLFAQHQRDLLWQPLALLSSRQQVIAKNLAQTRLTAEAVTTLYGTVLPGSVSSLEDFAACPFRFYASRGLKAEEREYYETDVRERGSLQHEILDQFHRALKKDNRRWRDLNPTEAANLVRQIGEALLPTYRDGLFVYDQQSAFLGRTLIQRLERMMAILVDWMATYKLDPEAVELSFGMKDSELPGWKLDLADGRALLLRGRIDRIDIHRLPAEDKALIAVFDYKSSEKKLDGLKLQHGLQLQLLSYLAYLRQLPDAQEQFGAANLVPVGAFYISLRGESGSQKTRLEAQSESKESPRSAHRHYGRFDLTHLDYLDGRAERKKADQFNDGARSKDGLKAADFAALLTQTEEKLRQIGERVFAGDIAISPYRKGQEVACEYCKFKAVCRFDDWNDSFRVLKPAKAKAGEEAEE